MYVEPEAVQHLQNGGHGAFGELLLPPGTAA
jgi:hypothetical protein